MRGLGIGVVAWGAAGLLLGAGGAAAARARPGADALRQAAPLAAAPRLLAHNACNELRPSPTRAYAAAVLRPTTIHGRTRGTLRPRDANGYRRVLGVLGAHLGGHCRAQFIHVELPGPPNGRAGWIPAEAVRIFPVAARIVVDLSERQLFAYRSGRLRLRARVAIGTARTPTPTGRYVVNERWLLANPHGAYGVAALGISAHSNVLHHWVQDGPIGLHGTNEPWTIGRAASHGCVRLHNADMRRLFALAPTGTPVLIRR